MRDFLRDLSPQRAHDAARAVPLLPSQFEAMHPLRMPQSDAATAITGDELSTTTSRSAAAEVSTPVNARAEAAESVIPPAPVSSQRAIPKDERVANARRPAEAASSVAATAAPLRTPYKAADSRPVDIVRPTRADAPVATATLRPIPPAVTALHAPSTTKPGTPSPATPLITSSPISARALAARPAAPTEQRPVVHVTIDRVEVRAPATPERPKPAARSQTASPGISLSEYLREREPERRGGVS